MSSLPTKVTLGPRFLRPFSGKPAPFCFSGLFLFSPHVFIRLGGFSLSGIYKAAGHESLFKRFDAVSKGRKKPAPDVVAALLQEMVEAFGFPDDVRAIFSEGIEAELALATHTKNERAMISIEHQIGEYGAFFWGLNHNTGRLASSLDQSFLIDVETASALAHQHLMQEAYPQAYEAIVNNELLKRFIWPDVMVAMKNAATQTRYVFLRALVAVEVHLAHLVIMDHSYETDCLANDTNALMSVWPTLDKPFKNPTALLFDWTKAKSGVRTISAFYDHPKLTTIKMEMVTLKRWSSGSHQPDREWLETLVAALFGDKAYKPFWHRYYMALAVNFIGYVHQSMTMRINDCLTESERAVIAPWPQLPHGYSDFATWGRERYPAWRKYACDYQAEHGGSSQASV
ncbi:MAG: hypothetical protein KA735_02685 [Burkholderiaceae bacterium]|nr:hypothetical protein [Burkholderiaceae bacterium]